MNAIRDPAVAGTFYPSDARELATSVSLMLTEARRATNAGEAVPKAIIAPHAGYIYSGPVAASVYARLEPARGRIKRVILLGPSHRVGFRGIAASNATVYRTPLGDVPVDGEAINTILQLPAVGYLDQAHTQEHSLEVHLPFLQQTLSDFTLVPLLVGDASKEDVARVLDALWGGDETLIVISSDLSHYHPYADANKIDVATSARILALDSTLKGEEACGCRPINGLLYLAQQRGLRVERVDVRNSGDTAGTRDQVVGYGAYVIGTHANGSDTLSLAQRQTLLAVARESILKSLDKADNFELDLADFPAALVQERATFVTLNLDQRLRGCIGSLMAHRPLVVDVANNAQAAAFSDPRFKPLTLAEFYSVDIHISVLTPPSHLDVHSKDELIDVIRPGIDGLIIEEEGRRATYLPSVWEQLPDPAGFVDQLRLKAGLPATGWNPSTRVFRYQTEEFC